MHRKIRVRLEPGTPLFLVSTIHPQNPVPSIELESYSVDTDRIVWIVRRHDGSLIEGRQKGEQFLRYFDQVSFIALALPNVNHVGSKGISPDFILKIPGHIIIASDPEGLRPVSGS